MLKKQVFAGEVCYILSDPKSENSEKCQKKFSWFQTEI